MPNSSPDFKPAGGWLVSAGSVTMLGLAWLGALAPGTNWNTSESKEGKYETA
jgi:hypothetical protein